MIICLGKEQVAQITLKTKTLLCLWQCLKINPKQSPLLQIFFSDLDEIPGLGGEPEEPTPEEHRAQAINNKALEIQKVRGEVWRRSERSHYRLHNESYS